MDMDELLTFVAQSGFSVAVAAYLLVRMESRLEALTQAINELRHCCSPAPMPGKVVYVQRPDDDDD